MLEIIIIVIISVTIYKRVQRRKQEGQGTGPHPAVTTTVRPQQRVRNTPVKNAIQEAREDGNNTTAYLMEKAAADAKEHERERLEEQKRLYEARGGLAVAERYLAENAIPQGKKCVVCGYCGAENLIPVMPGTRYSCYFCREPL